MASPENLRRKSTSASTLSRLSGLTLGPRRASESPDDVRGPLGLNLLHAPVEPQVDFIFVHGLRGGSRKTWSSSENINSFWPQEWLPLEPSFQNVRIHSFGYNSDWVDGKASQLTVHDFGQALLGEMMNSPAISGRQSETAIVLVGHSMGGIVIKKAFLQARQDLSCRKLCSRVHSMFFLATPHRGSDSAQLLKNLLSFSSSKSYVNDLRRGSMSTQLINDEFRNAYQNIQLWSLFETLPTTGLGLIVDRESAVLGLPGERAQLMNANHRNICKFSDRVDSNYLSLRNAFTSAINIIKKDWLSEQRKAQIAQLQTISDFLGVLDGPEADLARVAQKQTPGTCQWLTQSAKFSDWANFKNTSRLFWLEGEPATGKSTIAGHIIRHLETVNGDGAYFFFKHGDSTRSLVADALLSIAWQMARRKSVVRAELLLMAEQGAFLDRKDEVSIWRSLFMTRILKLQWQGPWYWVIDALDECANHNALLPLLAKLEDDFRIRVFVTSRPVLALDRLFHRENLARVTETVAISQSLADIKLFLSNNSSFLPVESEQERNKLLTRILNRSNGNFLWTSLVLQELVDTASVQQAYEVLDSVPTGMDGLYARIIETIMNHPRNSQLALTILKWCVCVTRPLTVEELREALKFDLNDTFPRLEHTIGSITGNLVIVDTSHKVQLAHQTVRAYLTRERANGAEGHDFAIVKARGQLSLSNICLDYLCGPELKSPRHRRGSVHSRTVKRSAFADYVTSHFSDHVVRSPPQDSALFNKVHAFFATNVLTWIEIVASGKSLGPIISAARNLKSYLDKRAKHLAPLEQKVRDLKAWATDLSYLVTCFGKPLLDSPSSIYLLIPPVCPPVSMIAQQSTSYSRALRMYGLNEEDWDDRVACIVQPGKQAFAVATVNEKFAIGSSDGIVRMHDSATMQESGTFDHKEHVRYVAYSRNGDLLATASRKSVKVWDIENSCLKWQHKVKDPLMCLGFNGDSTCLIAATRANELMLWDTGTSDLISSVCFSDIDETTGQETNAQRTPISVEYSPEFDILAVVYRQRPIVFWDLEEDPAHPTYIGSYNKETHVYPGPLNFALVFNPCVELIAASYDDGEIVVVNPFSQRSQATASEDSALLRASKDGEVLASGDGEGTITLLGFETLQRMYRIRSYPLNIRDLSFSSSGLQILEVRGDHCNVWQPAALVRSSDTADGSRAELSEDLSEDFSHVPVTTDAKIYDDDKTVTAAALSDTGVVYCGREDGSVASFAASNGKHLHELHGHTRQVAIASMSVSMSGRLLASVDRSGRIIVQQVSASGKNAPAILLDKRTDDVVVQVLIDADDQKLLVSMNDRDELWDLSSDAVLTRKRFTDDVRWQWVLHPVRPQALLLLEGAQLSAFDWDAFVQPEAPTKINIAEDVTESSSLTSFVGSRGKSQFCVMFAPHKEGTKSARLRVCDGLKTNTISSPTPSTSPSITTINYDRLAQVIKYPIGMRANSFFFLTHNGWVCSLETNGSRQQSYYSRHFFIPFKFHSNAGAILMFVALNRDVVLAYRSDVVVFSGGLDYGEQILINDETLPHRPVRPSMRSALGRNRSSPM